MLWRFLAVIALAVTAPAFAQSACDSELCRALVDGTLSDLRWPAFSDVSQDVQKLYKEEGNRLIWFESGIATPQAKTAIGVLVNAGSKGLDAEDYDGTRWAKRSPLLSTQSQRERSDLALTVSLMRYVAALHFGRLNPGLYHSHLDPAHAQFDLVTVLRDLAHNENPGALLASLEPPFRGYQETQKALERYVALAREPASPLLPPLRSPSIQARVTSRRCSWQTFCAASETCLGMQASRAIDTLVY